MLILTPAYGRKYTTEEAVLIHWKRGLDFKIDGGPYCSILDIDEMKKQGPVSIRWKPHMYISL